MSARSRSRGGQDRWEAARAAMVEHQLRDGGISDERVLAAMAQVPRERFVPLPVRRRAYADRALPIGHGQTISQPWIVAAICAGLELQGGEEVLEIGTGSGYSAAVLAALVGPNGSVRSVELIAALADTARATLAGLEIEKVEVITGDGAAEATASSYDAIAVHAAAPSLPASLAAALRPGGRLVVPLAQGEADMLVAVRRVDDGAGSEPTLVQSGIAACRFVPLLGEAGFGPSGR